MTVSSRIKEEEEEKKEKNNSRHPAKWIKLQAPVRVARQTLTTSAAASSPPSLPFPPSRKRRGKREKKEEERGGPVVAVGRCAGPCHTVSARAPTLPAHSKHGA